MSAKLREPRLVLTSKYCPMKSELSISKEAQKRIVVAA